MIYQVVVAGKHVTNKLCIMICKAVLQKSILVECTTDLLKVSFGTTPTYLQICIKVSFKHGMVHRYSCYGGDQVYSGNCI